MKKRISVAVALALILGLLFQVLPGSAEEPQLQEAPKLAAPAKSPPIINGHGTGFIPPPMDLSHLTGQRMPSEGVSAENVSLPPASFDWRTQGKVSPVKDQGDCGSCYAFASIGNIESKLLIDGAGTYDFSENHAKECNWYETANINGGTSCVGGNYDKMANLFSQKGTVLESCDPYVDSDVSCKGTCPYQITLLDWRIICWNVVPDTNVLKTYIQTHGPVYTSLYSSFPDFGTYDGSYTLYYTGTEDPDHAVLIVGWDDSLVHAGGTGGWIVKNSWGTGWGGTCDYGSEKGYFTIAYRSASIGMYSSFMYDWQSYDSSGGIMYYDEAGGTTAYGQAGGGNPTAWGLCKFIPASNTQITRVEFWTTDITTDIDVYIYDDFNGANLSNLLAQKLNNSFNEAGYHSVTLDSPLAVTSGNDVITVVKFTNSSYGYPVVADEQGPSETNRTYMSLTGTNGSWTDMGSDFGVDAAIRVRTSALTPSPPSVTTNNASNITTNSGTLNGNLTSLGSASSVNVSFQWGTTTAYGQETTPVAKTTTGPFSAPLSGLLPNTTYHFRAKAVGDGTSYGLDKSFTTSEVGVALVSIDPATQTVVAGGSFSVDVVVDSGGTPITACNVTVTFDPDLTATGVTGADLLGTFGIDAFYIPFVDVGQVSYGGVRIDGPIAVNGNFVTIDFNVDPAATGTYDLTIDATLYDAAGDPIAVVGNDGQVNIVTNGRKGDFDGDDDIDIFDFVQFADAYGSETGDPNYNAIGDFNDDGHIDIFDFVDFADVYGT